MTLRIIITLLGAVLLLLGGCNQNETAALPPPVALDSQAMAVFCGMNVLEHPGPKGQIIVGSRIDPFWFTSVRDAVAFTLMPDQPEVHLEPNKLAPYKYVAEVMAEAQRLGVTKIGIVGNEQFTH